MKIIDGLISFVSLIDEYIYNEIFDEKKLQQQMFEVRLKYEMDEISEEEYKEIKQHLEQRLQYTREMKQEEEEE
jgi:hypothetical protein